MVRSRLTQKFTLFNWNKFSKDYKERYKKENEKPYKGNLAYGLTLAKVTKVNIFGDGGVTLAEPDIEDVVLMIKVGNNNCSDEDACVILENYLSDTSCLGGLLGAMLDISVDFFRDLNISEKALKQAIELRDKYKEDKENKEDTHNE